MTPGVDVDRPAAEDDLDLEPAGVSGWFPALGLLFSVAGIGVSAYLTAAHYTTSSILACAGNGAIDCAKVTTSSQSMLLGVPIAVLGMAWFVVMAALNLPVAWRSGGAPVTFVRLAFAVGGIGFVLYLISAELLSIRAICLYCTTVHVLTFALFVLVLAGTSRVGLTSGSPRRSP
jgi:uncharacterized membrane protein